MNYTEEALRFTCLGDALLGIMTRPDVPATSGFIVVVGGPQYRVGSHRQFVLLSRRLAAAGYAVLRFDYRGMGDSSGQRRPFDSVSDDIAAAINALQTQQPSVHHITLWGLCDGASAALLYCQQTADPRVHSLCLLNPWVRSEAGKDPSQALLPAALGAKKLLAQAAARRCGLAGPERTHSKCRTRPGRYVAAR